MSCFVYFLISQKDHKYYIGVSKNPGKRLKEHNGGYSKSTKARAPFNLIRIEKYNTINEAYKRERFLKSKKSSKIIELIIMSSDVSNPSER